MTEAIEAAPATQSADARDALAAIVPTFFIASTVPAPLARVLPRAARALAPPSLAVDLVLLKSSRLI